MCKIKSSEKCEEFLRRKGLVVSVSDVLKRAKGNADRDEDGEW